jgi:hypothetical protein
MLQSRNALLPTEAVAPRSALQRERLAHDRMASGRAAMPISDIRAKAAVDDVAVFIFKRIVAADGGSVVE